MELMNIYRILRRWSWLIMLIVLVTGFALILGLLISKPVYEAELRVQISTPQLADISVYDEYVSVSSQTLITTARNNFMEVVKSKEVENRTIKALNLDGEDIKYKIDVKVSSDSDYIIILVEAPSPELAASIANTLASQAKSYFGELRAKPVVEEMNLYSGELRIAEEAYHTSAEDFEQYKTENKIGVLQDEIDTSQRLLEQLQARRDQLILEINTQEPISQINDLITQRQKELDRLLTLEPMHQILEQNYQEAREAYRLALTANVGPVALAAAEEKYRNAELAFNDYKTENNITSLQNEISVTNELLQQLKMELDQRVMDDADRQALLTQVDGLILERKNELDRLSTLQPVYNVFEEKTIEAQTKYEHILSKYSEAELKATVVRAANFIQIIEPAAEPLKAKSNLKLLILGIIGSLGVGIILAFLLDYFTGASEETILTEKLDLQLILGLPILGRIPVLKDHFYNAGSPEAEHIRQLKSSILLALPSDSSKTILITSPQPKDGKTLTVANLGTSMSESGLSVVIVDADLRNPCLHELFDQPNLVGTADLLSADEETLSDLLPQCISNVGLEGLSMIPAGKIPKDPSLLLSTGNLKTLIDLLKGRFDVVLFDSTPFCVAPDPSILAKETDGVLLVVRPGATVLSTAEETANSLRSEETNLLGVVLNHISPDYYYYYQHTTRQDSILSWFDKVSGFIPFFKAPGNNDMLSSDEVATMLGVRRSTVIRWCREGQIKASRSKLRWWVKREEIQEYLKTRVRSDVPLDIESS